jgi:hypothetical protein
MPGFPGRTATATTRELPETCNRGCNRQASRLTIPILIAAPLVSRPERSSRVCMYNRPLRRRALPLHAVCISNAFTSKVPPKNTERLAERKPMKPCCCFITPTPVRNAGTLVARFYAFFTVYVGFRCFVASVSYRSFSLLISICHCHCRGWRSYSAFGVRDHDSVVC